MNHFVRTGAAVFADTGHAVVALTFDRKDKRRAAAARQATEDLAGLFKVDTVRHVVVDPRWTQEEYSGPLNAHKAISRDERRLDLVGQPLDVARFLTALPRILDALESQATTAARRLGTWLRSVAGQTWIEENGRTPDGLVWVRKDFRAAVFRRCVDNVVDVPCTVPHVDADQPLVDQAEVVADRVSFEAMVDPRGLVDEDAAQAIVDAFRVVPLDETADSDNTRDVLAEAGDVVDAAAAALENQAADEVAAELPADAELDAAAALPCGLSVAVARSAWRDWWAADCTRCTGHPVQVSGEHADKADAVMAAWDHYDAKHRSADDALTLDEIDQAQALADALSDAQYDVLWDVHLTEVSEDEQGFYTYSVHTDAPLKRSRDRVVRLLFAGFLSAHACGEHRRTFRLTAKGDRARRLLFRARRHGVVELGNKDGNLGVPAAKMRRYPLLSAGHPVRCGLLPEKAPAAAVVPDTVDEVLAAAGDTAPVDVVDAVVKVPALVGAGAVVGSASGLPHTFEARSIQCVGNDSNRKEGTPAMSSNDRHKFPKMTNPQWDAFDRIRRQGSVQKGQGINRRTMDALADLNLVTVKGADSGTWVAKLAAPGLAIDDEKPAADEAPAVKLTDAQVAARTAMTANDGWAKAGDGVNRRAVGGLVDAGLAKWTINIPGGHWAACLTGDDTTQDDVDPGPMKLADPVAEWSDAVADADTAAGTTGTTAPVPTAPALLPNEARAAVAAYYPQAHDFQTVVDDSGKGTGYTFRVDKSARSRFGWITNDRTYGKGTEWTRSEAAALVPVAVLDDQRAAGRQVENKARITAGRLRPGAHGFQPVHAPGAPAPLGWTFRVGHGAKAGYAWVLASGRVTLATWQLVTTAEKALRHAWAKSTARIAYPDADGFDTVTDPATRTPIIWTFRTQSTQSTGTTRFAWLLADGTVDNRGDHMYRDDAEMNAWRSHDPNAVGALPYHGREYWNGARALCGYDDHRAPLRQDGKLYEHERHAGVIGSCPGSLRPPRTGRDEPTRQDTARVVYDAPRPDALASSAKKGDHVVIDGSALVVADVQPHEGRHHVSVAFEAGCGPRLFTLEDRLTYTQRVRKHDIWCKGCGVYVVAPVDEATQGRPTSRVCGLCDHQTTVAALAAI